jgi:hypothetical protein
MSLLLKIKQAPSFAHTLIGHATIIAVVVFVVVIVNGISHNLPFKNYLIFIYYLIFPIIIIITSKTY